MAEIQTNIYNYIAGLLGISVSPQLPFDGGYALQTTSSTPDTTYFDKETDSNIEYLLLGKSKDQQALADSLYKICNTLKKMTTYSNGIYAITTNEPSLVDIEGEFYVWQCQITVKYENGGN